MSRSLNQPGNVFQRVGSIGVGGDNDGACGGGETCLQGTAVAAFWLGDDVCSCLSGQLSSLVSGAIVDNQDL